MKIIAGLWEPDLETVQSDRLREHLASLSVTRVQLNLDDLPEGALRLQAFDEPLGCVMSLWCEDIGPLEALAPLAGRLAAWEVEERVPLEPPAHRGRLDALAQVAFLRRPTDLAYDAWLAHWHGPHTQVAIETQATFGYMQNRVVRALTAGTPQVDAIVEELFPIEALDDIHAFYGSDGSNEELDRRITRLMESVAVMGADHDLDVVPTSRYRYDL